MSLDTIIILVLGVFIVLLFDNNEGFEVQSNINYPIREELDMIRHSIRNNLTIDENVVDELVKNEIMKSEMLVSQINEKYLTNVNGEYPPDIREVLNTLNNEIEEERVSGASTQKEKENLKEIFNKKMKDEHQYLDGNRLASTTKKQLFSKYKECTISDGYNYEKIKEDKAKCLTERSKLKKEYHELKEEHVALNKKFSENEERNKISMVRMNAKMKGFNETNILPIKKISPKILPIKKISLMGGMSKLGRGMGKRGRGMSKRGRGGMGRSRGGMGRGGMGRGGMGKRRMR